MFHMYFQPDSQIVQNNGNKSNCLRIAEVGYFFQQFFYIFKVIHKTVPLSVTAQFRVRGSHQLKFTVDQRDRITDFM